MRKQLYTSLLCFCLLVIMFVGSSLAWFTDDAYYVDVMTTGNVKIEQSVAELSDFLLLPGETYPKSVTIANLGSIPCFVRTLVAFEDSADGGVVQQLITEGSEHVAEQLSAKSPRFVVIVKDSDGNEISTTYYTVGVYTYTQVLAVGSSLNTMQQLAVKPEAENDWCQAVGGEYDMIALSQATQATGWPKVQDGSTGEERMITAEEALNDAFEELTSEIVARWFAEIFAEKYAGYTVTVEAYSASDVTTQTDN